MQPSPPSERFRELAARLRAGDASVGLAHAALVLAGEFQPSLDSEAAVAELDRLGAAAARAVAPAGPLAVRTARLVDFMRSSGFRGNDERWDDPRNSFLNEVLARRTGIPITLAIVTIEVAARAGLELRGVSFPAHFLVRTADEPPIVIDAFHGRLIDERECAARLVQALGEGARFDPSRLAPARTSEIVVRMLANLKHGYAGRSDWLATLLCCERILLVTPDAAGEIRDRGLLYEQLECFGPALADLERFVALAPRGPEADALRGRIEALRPKAAAIH